MKKLLIALALVSPALHAEDGDYSLSLSEQDAETISQELDRSMTDFQAALADKNSANEILAYLRADPENDRRDIIVKVGNQVAEYYVEQRVETIGIKETLKPSQWAVDVGTIVKGATGGMSGSATVKVDVSRKDPKGGETTVKVEITISGKK